MLNEFKFKSAPTRKPTKPLIEKLILDKRPVGDSFMNGSEIIVPMGEGIFAVGYNMRLFIDRKVEYLRHKEWEEVERPAKGWGNWCETAAGLECFTKKPFNPKVKGHAEKYMFVCSGPTKKSKRKGVKR